MSDPVPSSFDVAVVGGGIAGMSVAAELSPFLSVVVLEQEKELAYHSSGRSAAAFLETYGSPAIRALTRASRPLFADAELVPRPMLWLATASGVADLEELLAAEPLLRGVSEEDVRALCPVIRPGWTHAAAIEDGAQDMDVAALFDRYRRQAVVNGVTILVSTALSVQSREPSYVLSTGSSTVRARVLVNAAGAWADEVATTVGVPRIGIQPLRRTIAIASTTVDRSWPLVSDIAEGFYFRPEGDALLVSLADETPDAPGDARAQMEDVALALENVNEATTLDLRHVRRTWAGLRTFAPDRDPVVGYDAADPSFFWLAGLGGYGMQTAPALAQFAAALIRHEPVPAAIAAEGLTPTSLTPARFARSS